MVTLLRDNPVTSGWSDSSIISLIALAVSILSLLVSGLNAWWTFYKDTHHRAKVRVALEIQQKGSRMVPMLEVMNHGPGTVVLEHYIHESLPWWRRLFWWRTKKHFVFANTMNVLLKAGEVVRQEESITFFAAGRGVTGIGVADTMRNTYFAPRFQVWRVNRYVRNSEPVRSLRKLKPPTKKNSP